MQTVGAGGHLELTLRDIGTGQVCLTSPAWKALQGDAIRCLMSAEPSVLSRLASGHHAGQCGPTTYSGPKPPRPESGTLSQGELLKEKKTAQARVVWNIGTWLWRLPSEALQCI